MKETEKGIKKFTKEEKIEIINYYKLHGATKASREFNVSIGAIYKWREAYESDGARSIKK